MTKLAPGQSRAEDFIAPKRRGRPRRAAGNGMPMAAEDADYLADEG